MKTKNYLVIILTCFTIIAINYISDYMFMTNNEILILIWTFINTIIFPIWIANYITKSQNSRKPSNVIINNLIGIVCYLLTYIIPSIEYFNFQTFTLNGDGASNAILTGIMFIGLLMILISFIIFHLKIKNSR